MRDIWRHESEVTGLTPSTRVPYRVTVCGRRQNFEQRRVHPRPKLTMGTTEDPADF